MIETIVQVDGMMCGMCESHINDAVRSHFQVKKVSSSHTKGQTVIQSQEPLDREQLVRAAALIRSKEYFPDPKINLESNSCPPMINLSCFKLAFYANSG